MQAQDSSQSRTCDLIVVVEAEAARIKCMLLPSKVFQSANSFKVPSSRSIKLAINRLSQVHSGVRGGTKDLERFTWKFQPQLSILW